MKFSTVRCRHRKARITALAMLAIGLMLIFGTGADLLAAEAEHGEAKGWVATDTYKVINFAVLAVLLVYLLRKPVKKGLNSRIESIKNQLEELEAKKKSAEEELAKYNQKFQQLDQEAQQIIDQYIQQGNDAKARIIAEAEAAAEKLQEQARRNIDHEFEKARRELTDEVIEKALAEAESRIKDKISGKDQERLVDEYLNKVVA